MRLFHFSDEPGIARFEPRPARIPVARRAGFAWLNGPLVWAIDEAHEPLYLFPRECPRILIWPTDTTTPQDRARWFGDSGARMIAFMEAAWAMRHASAIVHRYEFSPETFEDIRDAGMRVSRRPAIPIRVDALSDLPRELASRNVELRALPSLLPLKGIWQTSLHASGLRLRNAEGWGAPGWPHSPGQTP